VHRQRVGWGKRGPAAVLVAATALGCVAGARDGEPADPRGLYQQAQESLQQGQEERFQAQLARLRGYALYPYLVYEELTGRLGDARDAEVRAFLDEHEGTVLARRLRHQWLQQLGESREWRRFLTFYPGSDDTALRCYAVRAQVDRRGLDRDVLDAAESLWLVGRSQPDACDPVFDLLAREGRLTRELRWRRTLKAIGAGRSGLARYLARDISPAAEAWIELWSEVLARPGALLEDPRLREDTALTRRIVADGLTTLASGDPARAHALWSRLAERYGFSPERRHEIEREIALQAAYEHLPQAAAWLGDLPEAAQTQPVHVWQARTALRDGDWQALRDAILAMEARHREEPVWRYWLARALERNGHDAAAERLYGDLVGEVGYYGLLASDRLARPYAIDLGAPSVGSGEALMAEHPGLRRAHELYRLGEAVDARREWEHTLDTMPGPQRVQAAALAYGWDWAWAAIRAAAKGEAWDALGLRFPAPYRGQITDEAGDLGLDPAWVYAVMRRESAFIADIRSSAGALGLMQLMPATARDEAARRDLPQPTSWQLLEPARNIELGCGYLRRVLDRYDGNRVLATAAYNAGPARVDEWLPRGQVVAAERWVETIPYRETRAYIKAIMTYTTIFERRLGDETVRLSARMAPVGAVRLARTASRTGG